MPMRVWVDREPSPVVRAVTVVLSPESAVALRDQIEILLFASPNVPATTVRELRQRLADIAW